MTSRPAVPGESITAQGTFHTTHWTVVLAAREADSAAAREALASLCATYWPPLYAFIRRQGATPHEAEDLTQEFFARFLERNPLEAVRPDAGKFRSFLLTCLKHFLSNERRRARTQKRGGGAPVVSLEADTAEAYYLEEAARGATPEVLFERRWAFTVLNTAMEQLRQEYVQRGKGALFDDLRGFLPGDAPEIPRVELVARHGMSASAVDVAVLRVRKRLGALLWEQVSRTVASPDQVKEELRYLLSILGS